MRSASASFRAELYTGGMSALHSQELIERATRLLDRVEALLPAARSVDWSAHAFRARRRPGLLGLPGPLELVPVKRLSAIRLGELKEVELQKERLLRNTEQFVSGRPANNVLLTGARGTGKSSLIKAVLNEFAPRGLRLIEVDKADLVELPELIEQIAQRAERFIVFCDDLSFDEGESGYKALKSVLDGSVSAASENVLIYATSNRRHLLPEQMRDNLAAKVDENGELHPGEAIEEKISLSERFGLWLSFYPFSQDEYLGIVAQWLSHFGVNEAGIDKARPEALIWALERGSRSGRVAWQFARDHVGQQHE